MLQYPGLALTIDVLFPIVQIPKGRIQDSFSLFLRQTWLILAPVALATAESHDKPVSVGRLYPPRHQPQKITGTVTAPSGP